VLASLGTNYDLVYAWDATGAHSGSGNWLKFSRTGPGYANTLSVLDEKMGFWVHMTTAGTLEVVGSVPVTSEISLSTNAGGWNLVAYPSAGGHALPGVLSDHGVGTDFTMVYAFHANDPGDPWKLHDRLAPPWSNDLTEMVPGWGYWVRVSANNTWSVQY